MEFVAISALLFIGGLTYTYVYRKRLYKQIDQLEQWKISLMNRPVPEEMAKIKALNMMGETEQLFEKWRNEWDDIVAVQLPNIEEKLFDIEEAVVKYRFMKAKDALQQNKNSSFKKLKGAFNAFY
ncbi:Septation ring formation regulator EzrA [Anoxybacillus sp. BCO1]|nr:Septation ring formation regulator EzrA [Anoxybacillus sp. BCO1]